MQAWKNLAQPYFNFNSILQLSLLSCILCVWNSEIYFYLSLSCSLCSCHSLSHHEWHSSYHIHSLSTLHKLMESHKNWNYSSCPCLLPLYWSVEPFLHTLVHVCCHCIGQLSPSCTLLRLSSLRKETTVSHLILLSAPCLQPQHPCGCGTLMTFLYFDITVLWGVLFSAVPTTII